MSLIFSRTLSRRRFLKGSVAGGMLLSGLAPKLLRAAPGDPPRRLVVVSIGHSLDPVSELGRDQWVPPMTSNGIGELAEFLQPLTPFKEKMVAVDFIDNLVTRMVSSNGHNASSRTLLNCLPHAEYNGQDSPLDWQSRGGGPSIEYILAERLNTLPLILRSGVTNAEHRRTFLADGSDDQGNPDPVSAFANLFNTFNAPESNLSSAELLLARRAEILSSVRSTYEATASRAGSEDRERLQSHASLIDTFINELDYTPQTVCSPVPQLNIPSGYPNEFRDGAGRSDHLIAPLQNSLIATAFGCQATQVASLHYSTMQSNQFPYLNNGEDMLSPYGVNWHGFCHHDAGTPDALRVRAQTWYSEMLADLLSKLEQTPEGDGNVLDNTVVVFLSSLGNTAHSTNNIPFLLFGGANSGLATNQVVSYESNRRTVADMWTSVMQLMGQSDESFGQTGTIPFRNDVRNFNNGPLGEIIL